MPPGSRKADAKLAEERVRSAIRLGEERAKWSDERAVAIVSGFTVACRELETNIASSVARILQPFLASMRCRDSRPSRPWSSRSRLRLTFNSPVPVFRITGPSDLLDLVKAQLNTAGRTGIEYRVAERCRKSASLPIRP